MRINKIKWNLLGATSAAMLTLVAVALLCPMQGEGANAADEVTREARSTFQANIQPMVAIALQANVNVDIVPKASGNYAMSESTLKIATNSISGYTAYIRSGDENNNSLVNVDKTVNSSIKATEVSGALSAITMNSWGYAIESNGQTATESSTFKAVPTTATQIASEPNISINESSVTSNYSLAFGTKIDATMPAGSYQNSVVVSVVANPLTVTNLNQLVYMQDMTTDICKNTADYVDASNYVSKQLIDTRDGNSYFVAKLADGNCWMTQNLALNLSTGMTLTPADTDLVVGASYTPTSTTNAVAYTGIASSSPQGSQYSWNMGKIVLATPLEGEVCSNYGGVNSAKTTDNLAIVCAKYGFVDVAGSQWTPTLEATAGIYNNAEYPLVAVDQIAYTYDAHYLVGNYYQYNAATAGTGEQVMSDGGNATGSICPKGWKLPASGLQSNGVPVTDNDVYNLLVSYGYPNADKYEVDEYGNIYTALLNSKENIQANIAAPPVSFMRSGFIGPSYGFLRAAGSDSYLWTSTKNTATRAYSLGFGPNRLYPFHLNSQESALSIRCIAK